MDLNMKPTHFHELVNGTRCPDCGLSCQSVQECKEWQETLRRVREAAIRICGQ